MLTIVTLDKVPAFARGQVRDLRPRWALEEVGLPYAVRTIGFRELKAPAFAASQPFHQVPVLEEEGAPPLFESGAMLIAIAERSGRLLPAGGPTRARVLAWLFAAQTTIEPALMNVAEVDFFMPDPARQAARRPEAYAYAGGKLDALAAAIAADGWLTGDFSIADIMMATVLRIAGHTDLVTSRRRSPHIRRGARRGRRSSARWRDSCATPRRCRCGVRAHRRADAY